MAEPVGYKLDEGFTLAELLQYELYNLYVLLFIMSADIVDLAYSSLVSKQAVPCLQERC